MPCSDGYIGKASGGFGLADIGNGYKGGCRAASGCFLLPTPIACSGVRKSRRTGGLFWRPFVPMVETA